jgi:large subunit ribosomal protein L23
MELRQILIRPLMTEKATSEDIYGQNTYVFEVGIDANKQQIKQAVESYFQVEVKDVRTLIVRGKIKRAGKYSGKRSNWKKAYVTLKEGHGIELFGEE